MTAMTMLTVLISSEALCACAVLAILAMVWKTVQVNIPNNVCAVCLYDYVFKCPIPIFSFPDIDECVLGTYMCDVNAYCENTIGSYDCVCVDGFVENGTFCMSKHTSPRHNIWDWLWKLKFHVAIS